MSLKKRIVPLALSAALAVTAAPTAHAFSDSAGSWASEVIDRAAEYGLMEGYPNGSFGVGDYMTRAQFATVLCRLFQWEVTDVATAEIPDISNHWASGYILSAAAHGAVEPSGAFRPDDYISRAEMAQMLVRGLGYNRLAQTLNDVDTPFADVTEDKGYVAIAYDLGIINGVKENDQLKFLPSFSTSREEAAAMLVRCYERYHSQTDWLHAFYANSSYSQIDLTNDVDRVSVGWARLELTEDGLPTLNDTTSNNNSWVRPAGAGEVTALWDESGVPYNLTVFTSARTFAGVTTTDTQAETIGRLVSAARDYNGLTIDFEGLRADHREDFTAFMADLRAALPAEQPLYVCVQPDTWYGGFDYRALGEICDKVIMMAHDYQWSEIPDYYLGTTNTYCPVTPFDQVYTALQHLTDPDTGVQDTSKLALAISFNTTGFHVDEEGRLLDTAFYHPLPETIARRIAQPDTVYTWDELSHNPYIEYTTEDGEHYKLWYEDAHSVSDKLLLARMFGITGVSVWRLGIVPTYSDVPDYNVWSVLRK